LFEKIVERALEMKTGKEPVPAATASPAKPKKTTVKKKPAAKRRTK
jgi:hypothetical protein